MPGKQQITLVPVQNLHVKDPGKNNARLPPGVRKLRRRNQGFSASLVHGRKMPDFFFPSREVIF